MQNPSSDVPGKDLETASYRSLAPVWHTALIVALVATASIVGAREARHIPRQRTPAIFRTTWRPLPWNGCSQELFSGVCTCGELLCTKSSGHFHRMVVPLSCTGCRTLEQALVFWIISLMMLGGLATVLQHFHLHPENIRTTVSKLAPYSFPELIAWTVLSITAGICEEFIFRGYLQLQFARLSHRIWIGVASSAIVFGFSHGYEGLSGMLLIVAFGALFSILRLIRGNLRAGMIAHAWHDFLSGMVLSLIAHHKLFPLGS